VDDSTLLLYSPEGSHRGGVQRMFASLGVDPNRVRFIGIQKQNQYFETYAHIDIALDPFPFGGGTTTCDALWMGAPVVTLAGRTASSRGGSSILNQIGLRELVALRAGQYVEAAVALAHDAPRRAWLRGNLREVMSKSPLMDGAAFARDFESLIRQMWRSYCALP